MTKRSLAFICAVFFFTCAGRSAEFIGHRGDMANAPENTMSAFHSAKENGVRGCEIDVRQTKDGVLVLLHDASLKRTAGLDRLISDVTWSECERLDAGGWLDSKFKGERIPKLEEVLAFMEEEKMFPLFDVKDLQTEKSIIELAQKHNLADCSLFVVYSAEQSRRLKQLDERVTPMIQTFKNKEETEEAFFNRVVRLLDDGSTDGLFTGSLSPELLRRFHDRSIRVLFGLTQSLESSQAAADAGYDFIITDNPKFVSTMQGESIR